ncbi:MAG: T9SS type A sorting domain-containing protein [Bacteroidetes bacterium]|nr:MAG: T9SS type A sorting domain-containing protein [Bacteroidota bacterium]
MKTFYNETQSRLVSSRLLKFSAVLLLVLVWILIDKGNVYGQAQSESQLQLNSLQRSKSHQPHFRTEDDGDGRDGDVITDDGGDEFVVKPNPVQFDLVFDFEFTVKTGIPYEVVDPLGRLVDRGMFVEGIKTQKIDFSQFENGMYLVRLQIGEKMAVRRILKT